MPLERLQKIIARSGHFSRRQAEELITKGKVIVDGKKVTTLGTKVDPARSRISAAGIKIAQVQALFYILFHKPRQCMVTMDDPEGRKTIYDYLPPQFSRLKPVGRLDYDTEGLLLLTNDGDLALKMTHPRFHMDRVYEVKVDPHPSERQLERMRKGVELDGRKTMPALIEIASVNPKTTWIQMTLKEGRNRQVRRMCEKVGLNVKALVRTRMGPFELKGIDYGKWKEIADLPRSLVG